MNDWQGIFVVLAGLYLLESFLWLPSGGAAFCKSLRGKWEIRRHGWRLEALQLEVHFPPLISPARRILLCDEQQFGVGIHTFWTNPLGLPDTDFGVTRCFSFAGVQNIDSRGRKVCVDGEPVARVSTPASARNAASFLNRVKASNPAERPAIILAEYSRRLDADWVRKRLAFFAVGGGRLREACDAQTVLLFIVFPLASHYLGLRMIWLPLLLCALAGGIYVGFHFHRAHRHLYGAEDPPPEGARLTFALSPVDAAHAALQLHKGAVAGIDPLAIAAVVCDRTDFEREASQRLRQLMFPLPEFESDLPEDIVKDAAWFRKMWASAIDALIRRTVPDPELLIVPPIKEDDCCLSYCPRCCAQYVFNEGKCADCDLVVLPF